MAFYKQDIVDVNLETGVIHRSFLNHTIGHKDDDADRFGIRAFRNGDPVDLSGAQCQAVFMAPDGTNIALTSYGTVSGNEAYVTLPQACYNVEGQFCLAIKLVGGGVTATVRIIDGVVDRTGATGAVAPTEAVPTYQEILSTYAAMVSATSAANLAIAEEFDASENYPAGKNVINDGTLYVLPNGHTAGTTWANTTKVASNLGDQVTDLKSALKVDEKAIINLLSFRSTNIFIRNDGTEGANNNYRTTDYIPIKNGESFDYNIGHATELPIISFYTGEGGSDDFVSAKSVIGSNGYTKGIYTATQDGYVRFTRHINRTDSWVIFPDSIPDSMEDAVETVAEALHTRKNTFNLQNEYANAGYIKATGAYEAGSSYRTTDYLPIKNGDSFSYDIGHAAELPIISFYTSKDESSFIAAKSVNGIAGYKSGTYTATEDGYIRFTYLAANVDSIVLFKNGIPDNVEKRCKSIDRNVRKLGFHLIGEPVENVFLNTDGTVSAGSNYRTTDYIPIANGQSFTYRISHASAELPIIVFFTDRHTANIVSGKTVLGVNGYKTGTFTAEQDGYIRITYQKNRTDVYVIFDEQLPDNVNETANRIEHDIFKSDFSLLGQFDSHAYLRSNNGNTTANSAYSVTKYVPVRTGEKLYYHIGNADQVPILCFYDLMKVFDATYNILGTGSYKDGTFTVPGDGYVRLCWRVSDEESHAVFIEETPDIINKALQDFCVAPKKYAGKKIVNFGDSITGNKRAPNDISTRIEELTGAKAYNVGFGGCRMAQHSSSSYDPFCMHSLADAVANNDFTAQDAIDIDSLDMTDSIKAAYKESRSTLESLDFDNIDIITIAYGTNDFSAEVDLDNENNKKDITTFCGALRYSIETLLTAYPHLKIFLCTPTWRWFISEGAYSDDSDTRANDDGVFLTEYVEKEKEVGNEYHLKVIDNYYELGFNKFSRSAWFPSTDGTHPNTAGTRMIADHMVNEMF